MKRLFTTLFVMLVVGVCYASEPFTVYCTIKGEESATNAGYLVSGVEIDYGQENTARNYLVDETGRRFNFRSLVGALNYLAPYGWELHDSYTAYEKSLLDNPAHDRRVLVWILKKTVTSREEITEGFTTAEMYRNH